MKKLESIQKWRKHYDFNIQFFNNEVNIYVERNMVELFSTGGHDNLNEALNVALEWINKVNTISFFDFCNYVFHELNLNKWHIEFGSPPSECIEETKTIIISNTYIDVPGYYKAELFLHEIAHIGNSDKHNSVFYNKLSYLFDKFKNDIERIKN